MYGEFNLVTLENHESYSFSQPLPVLDKDLNNAIQRILFNQFVFHL